MKKSNEISSIYFSFLTSFWAFLFDLILTFDSSSFLVYSCSPISLRGTKEQKESERGRKKGKEMKSCAGSRMTTAAPVWPSACSPIGANISLSLSLSLAGKMISLVSFQHSVKLIPLGRAGDNRATFDSFVFSCGSVVYSLALASSLFPFPLSSIHSVRFFDVWAKLSVWLSWNVFTWMLRNDFWVAMSKVGSRPLELVPLSGSHDFRISWVRSFSTSRRPGKSGRYIFFFKKTEGEESQDCCPKVRAALRKISRVSHRAPGNNGPLSLSRWVLLFIEGEERR